MEDFLKKGSIVLNNLLLISTVQVTCIDFLIRKRLFKNLQIDAIGNDSQAIMGGSL